MWARKQRCVAVSNATNTLSASGNTTNISSSKVVNRLSLRTAHATTAINRDSTPSLISVHVKVRETNATGALPCKQATNPKPSINL